MWDILIIVLIDLSDLSQSDFLRIISKLEWNDFFWNKVLEELLRSCCTDFWSHLNHAFMSVSRDILIFLPHLQRTRWQPIRPSPMEQQHSEFHYPLEFSPHANLQGWIIEKPSRDAQTQVMVGDEWLWRLTCYGVPRHFGHQPCERCFPRHAHLHTEHLISYFSSPVDSSSTSLAAASPRPSIIFFLTLFPPSVPHAAPLSPAMSHVYWGGPDQPRVATGPNRGGARVCSCDSR